MSLLEPQVFLSPGSIAAAIETTVANIDSPTELNSLGTSQGELRIARTTQAGDSNETLYYLDTTSSAQDLPYIVTSATAGLKWMAMAGYAHAQALKLKVISTSTPVMTFGNINAYAEINNQNLNASSSASSDLVATADNGTATTHYVDLGINGSTGGAAPFTTANGAYLYTTDNQLDISAQGASGVINLSVGATPTILAVFDVTSGVTFNDKTTATKQFRYQIANQTAATIFTFDTGAQTVSRTLSVPVLGGNDTIDTLATAATLTGAKTFSAVTTVSNATAATTSLLGAFVIGNGTATTSIAMGSGRIMAGGNNHVFGDATHTSITFQTTFVDGSVQFMASGAATYWDTNIRPASGKSAFLSFTENGVADRWSIGIVAGDGTLHFSSNRTATSGTLADKLSISSAGVVSIPTATGANLTIASTTDATSSATGSAILSGGLNIAKNIIHRQGRGAGLATTVTAASTTTLTSASAEIQTFTGTTAGKIIQFPAANLFGANISVLYTINNQSTQTVTPTRAGSDTFQGGGTTDPVVAGTTTRYASDGVSLWMKV